MPDDSDPLIGAALVGLAFGCVAVALLLWSFSELLALAFFNWTRGILP